jgi:hypothetical protein
MDKGSVARREPIKSVSFQQFSTQDITVLTPMTKLEDERQHNLGTAHKPEHYVSTQQKKKGKRGSDLKHTILQ